MDFKHPIPVQELAKKYNLAISGNREASAIGINEIHKVRSGDITFVDSEKYYLKSLSSAATIIIINKAVPCPEGKTLLISEDPFEVYNQIVWEHRPMQYITSDRGQNVTIGNNTHIDHGVTIGHDVIIGNNCYIQPGVFIGDQTIIGDNVIIQAGALIGTDAFYYKKQNDTYIKWRSGGKVIIENDVEIAAACTINRGVSGETIIGEGSKLDCQVHVGHGAIIGKHCILAAQTGIGGKSVIGNHCTLYGQVGVAQNIVIGDHTIVLAKSGVSKNLDGDNTYFGYPAGIAREKFKELAKLRLITGDKS